MAVELFFLGLCDLQGGAQSKGGTMSASRGASCQLRWLLSIVKLSIWQCISLACKESLFFLKSSSEKLKLERPCFLWLKVKLAIKAINFVLCWENAGFVPVALESLKVEKPGSYLTMLQVEPIQTVTTNTILAAQPAPPGYYQLWLIPITTDGNNGIFVCLFHHMVKEKYWHTFHRWLRDPSSDY